MFISISDIHVHINQWHTYTIRPEGRGNIYIYIYTIQTEGRGRIRLRLRLIYLGRIAEKVKYITYLGCAPGRKTGKSMKNKRRQKEVEGEIKRRKKCRINVGKKRKKKKIGVSLYSERWALNLFLIVNNVFEDCTSAGRAFQEIIARGKKLFKDGDFL